MVTLPVNPKDPSQLKFASRGVRIAKSAVDVVYRYAKYVQCVQRKEFPFEGQEVTADFVEFVTIVDTVVAEFESAPDTDSVRDIVFRAENQLDENGVTGDGIIIQVFDYPEVLRQLWKQFLRAYFVAIDDMNMAFVELGSR